MPCEPPLPKHVPDRLPRKRVWDEKPGSITKLKHLPEPLRPALTGWGDLLSRSLDAEVGLLNALYRQGSPPAAPRTLPTHPARTENGAPQPPSHPSPRRDVRPQLSRWTRRCWSARAPPEPLQLLKRVPGWREAKSRLGSPEETSPGSWCARLGQARQDPRRHC